MLLAFGPRTLTMTRLYAYAVFLLFLAAIPAHGQTQHIRMAVTAPPATPVWRGAEAYRDVINKELDGKARIDLLPFPGDPLDSLRKGEFEMAVVGSALLASSKATRLALFDLPFFF